MFAPRRPGYSLAEVLVAVAIVAVLIGIVVPAVQRVRESAARAGCAENLRQIGLALARYHVEHNSLPPGSTPPDQPLQRLLWGAYLLPYIEQQALWEQTVRAYEQDPKTPPWRSSADHPRETIIRLFACPADGLALQLHPTGDLVGAYTCYVGVSGREHGSDDGMFFEGSDLRWADVTDGLGQTVLIGERVPMTKYAFGWWYTVDGFSGDGAGSGYLGVREINIWGPTQGECPFGPYRFTPGKVGATCDGFHFWSAHPGGAHFLFGDGSVRFLKYEADLILPALATRAGGEPAPQLD